MSAEVATVAAEVTDEQFVSPNPLAVLTDYGKWQAFYAIVEQTSLAHVPDITTQKGRDELKSVAFRITRTKTFLDNFGKDQAEEARKQVDAINKARRTIREDLEALKDKVRKPLTDWEEAEKERLLAVSDAMDWLRSIHHIAAGISSAAIEQRLQQVRDYPIPPDVFGLETIPAESLRAAAIESLESSLAKAKQDEADKAELARLRKEREDREREDAEREAEERRQREAADRARQAEEASARRAQEAADAARRAEQEQAAADARAAEERHAAELAAAEAETKRLADAEAARVAEEKRAADERQAREADQEHRRNVIFKATAEIAIVAGISEAKAQKLVLAIGLGQIPHIKLVF